MYGAILGDMIGAPYEFDRGNKSKDFPLFGRESQFTDDTAMTLAVSAGFMSVFNDPDNPIENGDDINDGNKAIVEESIIRSMKTLGLRYPNAGYGRGF